MEIKHAGRYFVNSTVTTTTKVLTGTCMLNRFFFTEKYDNLCQTLVFVLVTFE